MLIFAPDKRVRDQALSSLKTYLGAQSTISDLDLLKLWKGLFYCKSPSTILRLRMQSHYQRVARFLKPLLTVYRPGLWMQDKPTLQQRLSRDLASLVPTLRPAVVLPFLRAFFETIAREWKHIEALRLDKYLYLIRQCINASFTYLSRNSWNSHLVKQWNEMIEESPLEPQDMRIPNGLRYHVLDVWVDEMEKVDGSKWQEEEMKDILEVLVLPIEKLANEGKLKALRNAAKECLADDRLRSWRGHEDEAMEETREDEDDEEAEWGGIADD